MKTKYKYRNKPCTIGKWFVQGKDNLGGSGILEWCYDKEDAECRLSLMLIYPQFENLSIDSL